MIVKKIFGVNKTAKITRRLRNFLLPRIQQATLMSNDCMSLHTPRTGSTAVASCPIPNIEPHTSLKSIAVDSGLYYFVIRLVIKIGEKLQVAKKERILSSLKNGTSNHSPVQSTIYTDINTNIHNIQKF